jgi:large subunit ribosomal protein L10
MKREEKEQMVEALREKMRGKAAVVVDYQGINVAQSTELRRRGREEGVEFMVAKNTLARMAAGEAGVEELSQFFEGPTAIAFSEDPVAGAKLMAEFADQIEPFELKGGLLDGGKVMSSGEVVSLSRLPGREELMAQVVGGVSAPLTGLVTTLNGVVRSLVVVLGQVAEQKQ